MGVFEIPVIAMCLFDLAKNAIGIVIAASRHEVLAATRPHAKLFLKLFVKTLGQTMEFLIDRPECTITICPPTDPNALKISFVYCCWLRTLLGSVL